MVKTFEIPEPEEVAPAEAAAESENKPEQKPDAKPAPAEMTQEDKNAVYQRKEQALRDATAMVDDNSKTCGTWQPRDTMSWWSDGTSNQLVVGEKHIPPYSLGKCDGDGSTTQGRRSDCSYLTVNGWRSTGSARSFHHGGTYFPISPMNSPLNATTGQMDEAQGSAFHFGFGSWHAGICQFLIGDGSVKSISLTTPVQSILMPLATVNDGVSITLP